MPTITLTWAALPFIPQNSKVDRDSPWVNAIQWRSNSVELVKGARLYVIEIPAETIVYAGKATNVRSRFKSRSDSFRDFNLRTAVLGGNQVYTCSVAPSDELDAAERWLIRMLSVRDSRRKQQALQNITLTGPYEAPADGLKIINEGTRPYFLNKSDRSYKYDAGAPIGPAG